MADAKDLPGYIDLVLDEFTDEDDDEYYSTQSSNDDVNPLDADDTDTDASEDIWDYDGDDGNDDSAAEF